MGDPVDTSTCASVAPCGLVCAVCANATPEKEACRGCAEGGGDPDCPQRACSSERDLRGCWECGDFPCDQGYFAATEVAWRGVNIGSVLCIRDLGLDEFVDRLVSSLGPMVEYGDYRHRTPKEIRRLIRGDTG